MTLAEPSTDPRGPELPETFGGSERRVFSERTRERYERWRSSPQAGLFTETDWLRLVDVAELWQLAEDSVGDVRLHLALKTEIRRCEEPLGATFADRRRLNIDVTGSKPAERAHRSETIEERRQRLKVADVDHST